jgi:PAS domain S-box-containing protein
MTMALVAAAGPGEQSRLQLLADLEVLDTPPDPVLDGLVRCASRLLGYPIALVSLVDEHRQWFKARHGLPASETSREASFCAHAILGDTLFEVPDVTADPRFAGNPLVLGDPNIRAYAGMPLTVAGQRIGTLCLIDHQPRRLQGDQAELLADIAKAVAHWFESRLEQLELQAERVRSAERMALLEKLAEQAPGMLFQYRVDAQGDTHFSYVSPQVRELFWLDPDAVRDDMRPFLQRVHPDDRKALRTALAAAAIDTTPWRHEFRIERPGGGIAWRSARATPERQADGSLLWHGFIADITEQAEVEQLRRDKQAAEQASREKSAFLSRVSHELRTPLNAMLGFTQLLQIDADEPLTPRQHERVGHAHRAAQLLLGLINDVLDISRIEQGARQLALQPLSVQALVAGCLPMVAQMAAQAGVLLAFSTAEADPEMVVEGDQRALEQVLLNLLSNGVKYNRRGGTLAVALRADARSVWIDLRDQGPGLDGAQRARLFQPFERLGAGRGQRPGSGHLAPARRGHGGRDHRRQHAGAGQPFHRQAQARGRASRGGGGAGQHRHRAPAARRRRRDHRAVHRGRPGQRAAGGGGAARAPALAPGPCRRWPQRPGPGAGPATDGGADGHQPARLVGAGRGAGAARRPHDRAHGVHCTVGRCDGRAGRRRHARRFRRLLDQAVGREGAARAHRSLARPRREPPGRARVPGSLRRQPCTTFPPSRSQESFHEP